MEGRKLTMNSRIVFVLAITLLGGGCGVTSMPGKSFSGTLPPMTSEETELSSRLRQHVQMLAGDIGERNVWNYERLVAAADYLKQTLAGMGYNVAEQRYSVGGASVVNLIAELPGGGTADEIVVVGAHYDAVTGCPAANDNGSGVAATLEIARMFAGSHPARTVRFVLFVNEEPPFFQTEDMGSLVYARACKARGDNVVGMISLETIGYYSDAPNSQHYPAPYNLLFPSVGNYIAFVGDERSAKFVKDVIGSFRSHTSFPSQGVAAPAGVKGVGWSDHWSFWQVGSPALMVTDTAPFRYPHYHEPTDTPDKIDYDRSARVVAGIARVVRELAGASE
jgi:Zn-dependent M28 family amino/carboxypeptidase